MDLHWWNYWWSWESSLFSLPWSRHKYFGILADARADVGRTQSRILKVLWELYYLDTGEYPSEKMGLVALVKKPGELVNWRGPYLRREEALLDPWSRAYLYVIPGKHGPYDVSSYGRDGVAGGEGDDVDLNSW